MACQPPDHHRRSVRLAGYDYRWPGAYFVTLCTYRHRCVLGQVVGEETVFSELGELVARCWSEIPAHSDRASLGEFVIMPNHLHGIIVLAGRGTPQRPKVAACPYDAQRRFGEAQRGPLATIIGVYKSVVTRRVNAQLGASGTPFWQRNYYEHVIRDASDWGRIATYIASNPALWALDRLNGAPLLTPAASTSEDGLP